MSEERPTTPPPRLAPTVLDPLAVPGSRPSLTWISGLPPQLPARFGRYELQKLLGKGGMGAVYLARDLQLNRLVALKIPNLSAQDAYSLRDRFLREAQVAATLSHPNLCPVYDFGQVEGVLYLTMAYLEGQPLARFIRAGQQLPQRAVAVVVRQLALAMQAAHERGVIHRDLKPSNIMITPQKQPVIMDFGLARRTDADDPQITHSGQILGTPAYMSPEQLNSDAAAMGPASDIYSLGAVLYELLAGRPPFQGPLGTLMARIMTEPSPPLTELRPDIDPALAAICAKALSKEPGRRFAAMRDFAAALDDYLSGRARRPEPDDAPEGGTYELVEEKDDTPLNEADPESLFRAMAARQDRTAARPADTVILPKTDRAAPRPTPPAGRKRRRRVRLPAWLIPLAAGLLTLTVMAYVLAFFYQLLERRYARPIETAATAPRPARVAEEQRRQREEQMLAAALARLKADARDEAARHELDAWLESSAGQRTDLPPEVNLALGQHLILAHDRWEAGLRRLRVGEAGAWRRAAELDLEAAAGDAAAKVRSGDAWWDLARPSAETDRSRLRERAMLWYNQALPDLTDPRESARVRRRVGVVPSGG